MASREIFLRDTIHGIITLDREDPADALIWRLVNTLEFQRLRRIRQLGLTNLVYQGAEHTRFAHSIGVMHLAGRILDQLSKSCEITAEDRLETRVAALLHDLGHGPFSHVSEMVLGVGHEEWTKRIILDPSTQVNHVLASYDLGLPERIAEMIAHRHPKKFLPRVISGQLDADRLDYLLRDSTMTGVKYGIFDLERLLLGLEVLRDDQHDMVIVGAKGFHPTEAYLLARYHMYRQVYFHKTVWSAEAMFMALVRRAQELLRSGKLDFAPADNPVIRIMSGKEMALDDYLLLDDAELKVCMKIWTRESDEILADLARRIMHRDLYKVRLFHAPADTPELAALRERAYELMREKYGDNVKHRFLFEDATDIFYKQYDPSRLASTGILVRQRDGSIAEIDEISPSISALEKVYPMHMWCFPAEDAKMLQALRVEDLELGDEFADRELSEDSN
ncbi:HD domain-containing protein [bacterium]|nr:HD domain-containing protein [bacterium]